MGLDIHPWVSYSVFMTYREHIDSLATELGITLDIFYSDAGDVKGTAYINSRHVELTHDPDYSDDAYITALHVIGHVVVGRKETKRDGEIAAWQWARENSIVEISDYMEFEIDQALQTYRQKEI